MPKIDISDLNLNDVETRLLRAEAGLAYERQLKIEARISNFVSEGRLSPHEVHAATKRAKEDPSYMEEIASRPPMGSGAYISQEAPSDALRAIARHLATGPGAVDNAVARGKAMSAIYWKERDNIVRNVGATNTIDSALKRVLVLNETVRAFATRVFPLRLFSTVFSDVPLQGTDEVVVPYFPLQTAASSDFPSVTTVPAYTFGQATTSSMKKITVNKRKYQPLDFSSQEFRRQPYFDSVRLGAINAEKLGVDVVTDVLSVVTNANFGAAVKTAAAAAITSDDIVDIRGSCNTANWPDIGRGLLVDSTVDTALQKDSAYKLALNIGTTDVIQQGKMPNLSGFNYAWMPSLPTNGEKLIGFAAFMSGILAAFAPIDPAPGVRHNLAAYEVVTDPMTGISMNFRHWGVGMDDRDYQVIETAYGYQAGEAQAIKRICSP
jgi:hypothetical protein